MGDWRSIRLREINWRAVGADTRAINSIRDLSQYWAKDRNLPEPREGWSETMTLGDLADAGEAWWLRQPSIGTKMVGIIKGVIDAAAEGRVITNGGRANDAYVPKCEREDRP